MKRKIQAFFLSLFLLPLAFLSQGCILVPSGADGDLEIEWTFDGRDACPPEVVRVVVRIDGRDEVSASCTAGRVVIADLPGGAYTVRVRGIDPDGDVVWESDADTVSVIDGATKGYTFDLDPV